MAHPAGLPISVVIPAYRRGKEIDRAVRSVLAQTGRPAEIIVVDDASGDETPDVAETLGAHVIRLNANVGAAAARNAGIRAATGAWVALLDSDDEWLPHHLATLWAATDGHVAVAGVALRAGGGALAGRVHGSLRLRGEVLRAPSDVLFPENPITLSASMVRRDIIVGLGGFDEGLRYSEDFDLWLRVLELGTIRLIGDVTVIYHVHPGQKGDIKPATRRVQDAIVHAQRQRPWWRDGFGEQRRAVAAWDDFRQALRVRDRAMAARSALVLARRPRRWIALLQVWRYRWSLRRSSARWSPDGEPLLRDITNLSWLQHLGLIRRPPARAVVRNRRQRLFAQALGAQPIDAD